jgi:hypothetical protein
LVIKIAVATETKFDQFVIFQALQGQQGWGNAQHFSLGIHTGEATLPLPQIFEKVFPICHGFAWYLLVYVPIFNHFRFKPDSKFMAVFTKAGCGLPLGKFSVARVG